ncbi:zinc finger BED domain-containing protein 1 isoform X1 [Aplysia californica]|uniref:Zinc finger BED domain-containing protein 1 isoform X1 n=1 Tax=Aplysia californica TaxID=6500 RepID=A0ABM0JXG3_APLCA|nr:zinc finger BED domain-containing protein 1 isoform X1 [Aplysia californica]
MAETTPKLANQKNKGPRRPRSVVWYYFDKIPNEPQRAKCKLCGATCHHANNTSNLFKHLRVKHPSTYKEAESQREAEMELYLELKAKAGKPVTRPGVRGRRPKALVQNATADATYISQQLNNSSTAVAASVGLGIATPGIKKSYGAERVKQNTNKALLKMLTVDLQPASIVEGRGFRDFVKALDVRYEPPSKKTIMKTMLNDLAEETKNKVKLEVVIASFFAITVDTWMYRGSQNFITVSAHFIKDNWEMSSIVLETFDRTDEATGGETSPPSSQLVKLDGLPSHTPGMVTPGIVPSDPLSSSTEEKFVTGPASSSSPAHGKSDALALSLKRITDEWNISERIISLISNGTDNTVTAATLSTGWEHLVCFGHTLNLVINNALKSVAEIVRIQKKTSDAVGYFETCVKASDTLSAVQQQHNLPVHKLKQESSKFWNSTYAMFVRMVEQYEAVNTVLCFLSKDHMCLCDDEVELMRSVIEVLKPFEAATQEICTSGYTFMSKVIPIATLLQQVTASGMVPLSGPQSALKSALLQQMQQQFSNFENSYTLAVSTLLDPRFKRHAFTDMAALESAQHRLLGEITQTVQSAELAATTTGDSNSFGTDATASSSSSFWNMFDRKVSEAGAMKNTASEAENESRRYFKEANIPRKADPLQWWKLNEVQFPHLKILAQKYLCIPATSVSSDRLFSKQGHLVEMKRDLVKPNHLHTILFLNKNLA